MHKHIWIYQLPALNVGLQYKLAHVFRVIIYNI